MHQMCLARYLKDSRQGQQSVEQDNVCVVVRLGRVQQLRDALDCTLGRGT